MHIIIDGYNVIGMHPGICLSETDKEEQFQSWLLACLPERCKDRYTIVFDGNSGLHAAGRHASHGLIKIRYTYGDETADDAIIKMVEKESGKIVVVSDDNHIKYHIKKQRAISQSVAQFIGLMQRGKQQDPDAKPQEDMNDYLLSQWLDVFSDKN